MVIVRRHYYELAPLEVIRADDVGLLHSPGSVSIYQKERHLYEALICNNAGHTLTRHLLDLSYGCSIRRSEVLLKKWLDIPDGVCISEDRHWIAISNHNSQSVFIYDYTASLDAWSDPDAILRCVYYPHGLRFTPDGRFIIVADAGAPYVHIYAKNRSSWGGVHHPIRSLRVINDQDFLRGRHNPQEGGPKGIDLSKAMNILAITCESQPLAFFDLSTILENAALLSLFSARNEQKDESCSHAQRALEMKYELEIQRKLNRGARAEAQVTSLKNSRFWRITAPLRRVLCARAGLRLIPSGLRLGHDEIKTVRRA